MKLKHKTTHRIRKYSEQIRIKYVGPSLPYLGRYETNHNTKIIEGHDEITVEVIIDEAKLCEDMAHRAANTKSGKSSLNGGLIKCKIISRKELSRTEKPNPIPSGYEKIEPQS